MKLYYYKDPKENFGDDLNPWLFGNLLPELLDDNEKHLLIGVGTLLNHKIPNAKSITVFGSGYGYGNIPVINKNWAFSCVRGPRTAAVLGLPSTTAVTDPAILASVFYDQRFNQSYEVSLMPHCLSAFLGDWQYLCKQAGIHFIDPRQNFLEVFAEIKRSKRIITEAMHGAILADAFRVPWLPFKAYPHISEFKWQDWLDSMQLNAEFNRLPSVYRGDELYSVKDSLKHKFKRLIINTSVWQQAWTSPPPSRSCRKTVEDCIVAIEALKYNGRYHLSNEQVHNQHIENLLSRAALLRKEYGA